MTHLLGENTKNRQSGHSAETWDAWKAKATANLATANIYLSTLLKEYNMKIKTLALVMLSALTSAAAYADTVNGGTVHFKGEVVNAACAVGAGLSIRPFS